MWLLILLFSIAAQSVPLDLPQPKTQQKKTVRHDTRKVEAVEVQVQVQQLQQALDSFDQIEKKVDSNGTR